MKVRHLLLVLVSLFFITFYFQNDTKHKQDYASIKSKQVLLIQERDTLQEQKIKLLNDIKDLENQLIDYKEKFSSSQEKIIILEEQTMDEELLPILENENIALEKEVTDKENELLLLQNQITELNNLISDLEALNATLKEENDHLKSELLASVQNNQNTLEKINDTSETIRQSNIFITTTFTESSRFTTTTTAAVGSGTIFKKDATYYYALTNFHVVNDNNNETSESYKVNFHSGQEALGEVEVVASGDFSTNLDLAVIKFKISDEVVPLMKIDPDNTVLTDEFILVVGNPNGLQDVVSTTALVGENIYLQEVNYPILRYRFGMNTSGNSGGAVVDIDGDLQGVHTWSNAADEDDKYAIPIDIVYDFLTSNDILQPIE